MRGLGANRALRHRIGGVVAALEVDEYGPVDYVVVEFPAGQSQFTGEMASALNDLVERGLVRKNVAELLAEDDVAAIAAALEPGSIAGVLVWENSWAAPFASAIRRAGGQLVATGRIPIQAILAAIGEEQADREGA